MALLTDEREMALAVRLRGLLALHHIRPMRAGGPTPECRSFVKHYGRPYPEGRPFRVKQLYEILNSLIVDSGGESLTLPDRR